VNDLVNHPPHYTSHSSGIEAIEVTENLSFCLGNAVKYLLRRKLKGTEVQDLQKSAWYLERETVRLQAAEEHARFWHPETTIRRLIAHEPPGAIKSALISIADGALIDAAFYVRSELDRLET
jgi:hypothetical protein